jgi:hypothetical protein
MSRQFATMLFAATVSVAITVSGLTHEGFAQDLHPGVPDPKPKPVLESVRDIAETLRACWVPPPLDQAYQGMTITVRFTLKGNGEIIAEPRIAYATEGAPAYEREVYRNSVIAAFARCVPLPLNAELRRTIVGRLIWLQFVDSRKIAKRA